MALESILQLNLRSGFGKASQDDQDLQRFDDAFGSNLRCHTQLAQPPFADPNESMPALMKDDSGKQIKIHYDKGTTTLCFKYKGGVVVAADSRATGGEYIGSQSVKKIIVINKYLLGTMAGGAADCVYWQRVLSERCRIYELRNRERISVAAASKLLANILYNYKGMGLSLGVMISGWDKRGPGLYYVDNEGNRLSGSMFSSGSGSTYAFGVLDNGYKFDMEDGEAFELARKAIYHATFRDSASGGIVRVYRVTEAGWECISEEDCMDLHYKYQAEKMQV
ncbi:proteasome subunit beta type-5 [Ixodes scapularis]|uniref:proteasome endopeptidase complex n=1 Tax=Ixodes scapularis TaxID=6945 RepID=B7PNX6_IXOSC|nr:proteasome subunit beta type-5 [Ixodes scapularis]EEC08298.1 20S proteasome, regulatory subunit beta, putative [Ixodes scapularis]|eukprot:XP_002435468.1 20S proteasome, regulatory subunit beta, putative [Ixodes scapularis]